MNWFFANGNERIGPISESELRSQRLSGMIGDSTLIWAEGMDEWKPYCLVFRPHEPFENCKLVEKDLALGTISDESCQRCSATFFSMVKQANEIVFSSKFWSLVGMQLLMDIVLLVGSYFGGTIFLQSPTRAGVDRYFLQIIRGKGTRFSEGFSGFTRNVGPLILHNLILGGVVGVIFLLGVTAFMVLNTDMIEDGWKPSSKIFITGGCLIAFTFIPTAIMHFLWSFAIPLMVDKQIRLNEALRKSKTAAIHNFGNLARYSLFYIAISLLYVFSLLGGIAYLVKSDMEPLAVVPFLVLSPLSPVIVVYFRVILLIMYREIFEIKSRHE